MTPSDSEAICVQSKHYPERFRGRVPRTVCMLKKVESDDVGLPVEQPPIEAVAGHDYPVFVNSHGAVSAIIDDRLLGLKPDEFQVVTWHSDKDGWQRLESGQQADDWTMRDDFACAALQGILASHAGMPTSTLLLKGSAAVAYEIANAMMTARKKVKP